jgi:hypothetical protein
MMLLQRSLSLGQRAQHAASTVDQGGPSTERCLSCLASVPPDNGPEQPDEKAEQALGP